VSSRVISFAELQVASNARGTWRNVPVAEDGPVLGAGTFGKTFKGTWSGRDVAIKRLHDPPRSVALLAAFAQEAAVLYRAGEANRNVVRCLGVCTPTKAEVDDDDAAFCIVMEFVAGPTLDVAARTLVPAVERTNFAVRVGLTVARVIVSLQRMPEKVYHLDLKPANMIFTDAELTTLKVLDFGIARVREAMTASLGEVTTGVAVGSPGTSGYIDPQILRTRKANARSDIFSLGSVLFFCATGGQHLLHAGVDDDEQRERMRRGELVPIPADVDARISAVIAACWRLDPAQRPSAEALVALLASWGTPEWDALARIHLALSAQAARDAQAAATVGRALVQPHLALTAQPARDTPAAAVAGASVGPPADATTTTTRAEPLRRRADYSRSSGVVTQSVTTAPHISMALLLAAFRDVNGLSDTWNASRDGPWHGVTVSPKALVAVNLQSNQLSGYVNLAGLPPALSRLNLSLNQLSGIVDLTRLPPSLRSLDLRSNQLTGAADLTNLPATLAQLWLSDNQLTGAVDLTNLPATLVGFSLTANQLTGAIDLTNLPPALEWIHLSKNQLTGAVDLTRLPRSLTTLKLVKNVGLTGHWRGAKPDGFEFGGTGITTADV
jgi:serine/threonine protein kinase